MKRPTPGRGRHIGAIAVVVYGILAILNWICLKAVERKTKQDKNEEKKENTT